MNIVTWNMQGSTGTGESKWNTDVKRLFLKANVEVALLQEAGMPPLSAAAVVPLGFLFGALPPPAFNLQSLLWNLGTASRPRNVGIFWLHCDLGANRNNLART
jgi:cytolethal distending toxin subunit B